MARRDIPEVNAGSMADIAFILLIFFLVSTTLAQEQGVKRVFHPWDAQKKKQKIHERNVLSVEVDEMGQLKMESQPVDVAALRSEIPVFMLNNGQREDYSESYKKAVVNLESAPDAPYESYLLAYSAIRAGFKDIRNAGAQEAYGKTFEELQGSALFEQQASVIRATFPLNFNEQIKNE